jgi:hypothetical protein
VRDRIDEEGAAAMGKRAICVGINRFANYPQFALNGCVNDARDMAALCRNLLGFRAGEVKVLADAQATKAKVMALLAAAVRDAKAGKIGTLLFSFSSHGTQMADKSGDEPDGMDEAFVPYDIAQKGNAWDPARIISDDELHDLFRQLPANVLLEVYLDTCHSGSGLRGAEFSLHAPRPRFIAPPAGELQGAVKQHAVRGFLIDRPVPKAKRKAEERSMASGEHHILWTGCKANQTSADSYFNGRYNGAFTYAYVKTMMATNNRLPRKDVIKKVREVLKGKFSQVPQLEGNATNRNSAILY